MTIDNDGLPALPDDALEPNTGPHANRTVVGQGLVDLDEWGPDALSNVWRPSDTALGNVAEGKYATGPGNPDPAGPVEPTVENVQQVNRQPAAPQAPIVIHHVVETIKAGNPDARIFRVQVGPQTVSAPLGGGAAIPTTVLDQNPLRVKALIRNVSATAVSIFLVRAGSGGNGTYDNIGYRLQQNGETIEWDSCAGLEAYCTNATDAGILQVIEEFSSNTDGTLGTPE